MSAEQQKQSLPAGVPTKGSSVPVLRVLRRTTWATPEEFAKGERLRIDGLRDAEPSIYRVQESERGNVVRMHAEHCTITPGTPNASPRWHVDARDFPHDGMFEQRGQTKFRFTQETHACLALTTDAAADRFIAAIFEAQPKAVAVPLSEVRAYASERLKDGDVEWNNFLSSLDEKRRKEWSKWIDRKA